MLAEATYDPGTAAMFGGLGLICGIAACVVLASKGYVGEGIASIFLGLVCFPLGLIALIVALTRKDKRQAQGPRQFAPPQVLTRKRRQQLAERQAAYDAANPPPVVIPAGFVQCPRCGQQCNAALTACWNCKLPFQSAQVIPTEIVNAPPTDAVAPGPYAAPFQPASQPDNDGTMQSDASVGMAQYSSGPQSDATPIVPAPNAALSGKEIKVRCKSCGRKFGGTVAQIASLKACPRCKATPFVSEAVLT